MEDMQTQELGTETGSTQAEAAPSAQESTIDQGGQTNDNDPKGIAFGKALTAEREKIRREVEAEYSEKYKGHEDYKLVADYLQEANGLDLMSLKERIEMERLQVRAEKNNLDPETQKRLEYLEERDRQAQAYESQQIEAERVSSYWSSLNEFANSRDGIDAKALNQFMLENGLMYDPSNMERSFTVAYKAMMHDQLQSKLESAEKEGVKKFLQAKGTIPTVPGSTTQGHVSSAQPKTFAEARQRAMQRLSGG